MTIDLFEQRVNLKIDDDFCRVGKAFRAFSIAARLLVILHSQVQFGAFIPGGAHIRNQFHPTIEMGFAGGEIATLCQKPAVVVVEKPVVERPTSIDPKSLLVRQFGAVDLAERFEVKG